MLNAKMYISKSGSLHVHLLFTICTIKLFIKSTMVVECLFYSGCLQFSDLFCFEGSTFSHPNIFVSYQVVRTAALTQWVTSMDISPMGHLIAFATEGSLVLNYILFFRLKGTVVKFSQNPQHGLSISKTLHTPGN